MIRETAVLAIAMLMAGCVSSSRPAPAQNRPAPQVVAPPPQSPAPTPRDTASTGGFIAPQIMQGRGLEGVIGQSEAQLERQFGAARLNVWEGDARKLQFVGEACVLDVFLYPLRPGATPSATHIEARRASDGRNVDRASCVSALRRR